MVLVLSRRGSAPKERRFADGLLALHQFGVTVPESALLAPTISFSRTKTAAVSASHWPFLSDAAYHQKDLDIAR